MDRNLEQIRELNCQAWALCKKDSSAAMQIALQSQNLLSSCPDAGTADEFECLKTQTYCLDMLNRPEEALETGLRANQLAEQTGDKYSIGSIQSLLGRIYWHIDDFPTAIDYYLQALKLVQTEKYPDLEISLTNGLGLVQYGLGNYPAALGYFQTCLDTASEDDLTGRADANNNIAYVLHLLERNEEAITYGMNALALFDRLGTSVGKMETLHSLGSIHFALGNYDRAMNFLEQGVELARNCNSQLLQVTCILDISRIHQVQGELDCAESETLIALEVAQKINSLTNIANSHERLVEIYKAKQDYKSALYHFEGYHAVTKKMFNDKSDRRIKNLEILHQVESVRKKADLYRELSRTDSLTALVNRRGFLEGAELALEHARITKGHLAILMLDIDHFKNVNDSYGHKVGDEVLSVVGSAIKDWLRKGDVAARYGGEEFVVMVVGASPEQCLKIAERMRKGVARLNIQVGELGVKVTISVGVASLNPGAPLSLDDLINCADAALYEAKHGGRNRVVASTQNHHATELLA